MHNSNIFQFTSITEDALYVVLIQYT